VSRAFALAALLALVLLAGPAWASEERPTLEELERELICPTCETTLAVSSSPIADRMRVFIRQRIAAGDTKSEIKAALVAEFGEEVLAAPPKRGFNLLAWVLPLAGLALAALALGVLARRWLAPRADRPTPDGSTNGRAPLDPDLERRLDEELARFEG
jgi:cytochrome c-type biogenesis protein CcmH/NrfF